MSQKNEQEKFIYRFRRAVFRIVCVLLTTVLLVCIGAYGLMYVLCKGPSVTARDKFVMTVRETSAIGFLADLFFTPEEIAQIESGKESSEYVPTDTELVSVTEIPKNENGTYTDAWGFTDDDGDGIVIDKVYGEGYSGYMMIVYDPSRVIVGCDPENFGVRGYSVEEMAERFDAVGGTNAGGFVDPEGQGNGSAPDTLVVFEGEIYFSGSGVGTGFVGFDKDYKLHVGVLGIKEITDAEIRYGVCFGPARVINGEKNSEEILKSGINPRTAIGQRSDGAVLMLVIDGRQVSSIGASYDDLADIMLDYGAVNAGNLDGGSSTLMWYDGEYINSNSSVVGIRKVPTTILVLKEGEQ